MARSLRILKRAAKSLPFLKSSSVLVLKILYSLQKQVVFG